MMQQIPPGMASVNGRAPVPLNQAVEEVVDAFERKLQGQRERPAKDVFDKAEPGGIAPERLRSIVERVERLEEHEALIDLYRRALGM